MIDGYYFHRDYVSLFKIEKGIPYLYWDLYKTNEYSWYEDNYMREGLPFSPTTIQDHISRVVGRSNYRRALMQLLKDEFYQEILGD